MPQLLSRMDDTGWLTPAIAEMLDEVLPIPHDEKFRREQAVKLQKRLAELGAPARVTRIAVLPSHTLFLLQPGATGRRGATQRITSAEDIAHRLPRLRETLNAQAVDVLPRLRRAPEQVGLLVRMADHGELRLRNLLLLPVFQAAAAKTSVVMGMDLEQQAVVRDLAALPHLLILGDDIEAARQFLRCLLLTLALFNTPAECRIALMNTGRIELVDDLDTFARVPHVLGRRLRTADESLKLLDGLVKERERRKRLLERQEVDDLESYNARVRHEKGSLLPRIIVVMEELLDPTWNALQEKWLPPLGELLTHGHTAGIHLILIARTKDSRDIPNALLQTTPAQVVLRSATAEVERLLPKAPAAPLSFVDGFLVEGERGVAALEFCRVTDAEIERIVTYWRQAAAQRAKEIPSPVSTGVTGLLNPAALSATENRAEPAKPSPPTPQAIKRITEALTPEEVKLARARALAAYLGWLGSGPLHDVMGMGTDEAQAVLARLRETGYLEAGEGPTWRFVRLDNGS